MPSQRRQTDTGEGKFLRRRGLVVGGWIRFFPPFKYNSWRSSEAKLLISFFAHLLLFRANTIMKGYWWSTEPWNWPSDRLIWFKHESNSSPARKAKLSVCSRKKLQEVTIRCFLLHSNAELFPHYHPKYLELHKVHHQGWHSVGG